jgi:hypothetical protein
MTPERDLCSYISNNQNEYYPHKIQHVLNCSIFVVIYMF